MFCPLSPHVPQPGPSGVRQVVRCPCGGRPKETPETSQPNLFDLTFYWGNWGNWGTYHYDYAKPQAKTIVTANGSVWAFRSTVSATFNQGGGRPAGVDVNDSVTFSLDIPIASASSASPIGFGCAGATGCNTSAWTLASTQYELHYSGTPGTLQEQCTGGQWSPTTTCQP